ncbi:hypothetical protein EXE58_18665 [Nocardioides seonyuensis]|uniref:Aromatic ring-opening dioxygenase LigA n=1 Tax=Nocardioides seonyuensis TaxID=2518371 RepID=A0A4P7IIR0_9ACTN|nr:hypothetical protein [Nocardioides seonyuensis]QBX57248.1 hypothetical protein EXE58_18665 [Nocardioides seonyuensis]
MRAFVDKLVSWTGLALAVVLLIAGGLLTWASVFIGGEVDKQLSDQQIVMPVQEAIAGDEALSDADRDALEEFAGSKMDTGAEAKAYADHYILAHTNASTGGETYATLGDKQREVCPERGSTEEPSEECNTVNAQRATAQTGSTLRGLLLYGYAFATMGTIAGIAAVVAFIGAAILALLALLGLRHSKRADVGVTA